MTLISRCTSVTSATFCARFLASQSIALLPRLRTGSWGLRDYGTGTWEGGDPKCDHTRPSRVDKVKATATSTLVGSTDTQAHLQEPSYREVCGKCGARRVDRQLGLEPTPDEYVANMVAVFREVRRVLADHGTCWVNLGDSYATGTNADRNPTSTEGPNVPASWAGRSQSVRRHPEGLKPKDLVGIPWRVAFALQQPYYAGRIKDERDRIWLAAMVDAEGCIHIHRRKAGTDSGAKFTKKDGTVVSYARTQDTYGVMVSIDNTSKAVIDRCEELIGQGSRYVHEKATGRQQRKQTLYRLTLTGQQSRELLRELYPHLVAKQHEARIAYHSPSSGEDASACHEAIKSLHNGRETTVDKPAPPTLFEPGWYLRSDICWAKSNPMPESVTDRPTKAHEYVFLLSKSPRYHFDQEAVREPAEYGRRNWSSVEGNLAGVGINGARGSATVSGSDPSAGRNVRSVWQIATQPYAEAHFATFPEELPRRCILAGCPTEVCRTCGKPRERIVEREKHPTRDVEAQRAQARTQTGRTDGAIPGPRGLIDKTWTLGWSDCGHGNYRPGVVLDPFGGSGTTALVARNHGRRSILIELNPAYAQLAADRLSQLSLLAEGAS